MTEMTERQVKSMQEYIDEADKNYATSMREWSQHGAYWTTTFEDETRPGRGHVIDAIWCDGEKLVQIRLDPYGNGSLSVAEVDWLHSSSDEECGCDPCEKQREEDDE